MLFNHFRRVCLGMLWIVLPCVLLQIVAASCVHSEDSFSETDQSREQWLGYIDALIANNRSLQSYDLRMRVSHLIPDADGQIRNLTFQSRRIHDSASGRYLCVSVDDREIVEEGEQPFAVRTVWGADYEENGVSHILQDGATQNASFKNRGHFVHLVEWPNFLAVGVNSYPVLSEDDEDEIARWQAQARNPDIQVKVAEVSNRAVRKSIVRPLGQSSFVEINWVFDTNQFVPTSRRVKIIPRIRANTHTLASEQFRWEERDGIMLPVSISKEQVQSKRDGVGDLQKVVEFTDVEFEWITVKEEFEPEELKISRFDGMKDLLAFVLPEDRERKSEAEKRSISTRQRKEEGTD